MAIVEASHKVRTITAIYDTDKKEIICYTYIPEEGENREDYDWYYPRKRERFFDTVQEARLYVEQHQNELRAQFATVKAFLEEMNCADKEHFGFKEEEYLGEGMTLINKSLGVDYWENEWRNESKKSSLLTSIARSRHFNVNGETINIDLVCRVEWLKDNRAILVMQDGHKVYTYSKTEYNVVVQMFGSNRSDRIING